MFRNQASNVWVQTILQSKQKVVTSNSDVISMIGNSLIIDFFFRAYFFQTTNHRKI